MTREAEIVTTDDGGVTVQHTSSDEFGNFGLGLLAYIVERVPVSQLPAGTTVATVTPGDAPLQDRLSIQHGVIRRHASDCQTTLGSFAGD